MGNDIAIVGGGLLGNLGALLLAADGHQVTILEPAGDTWSTATRS